MQVNTAYPLTDDILETYRAVIGKEVCNAYLEKEGAHTLATRDSNHH